MAWATAAETLTYTGITVTDDEVERAQVMIEIFADVTEDSNDNIGPKNLRLLRMAVAYQAAWMTEHPDTLTNADIGTMLQDGLQYTNAHANAGILAPMAKRALDRLSWQRGNRSLKIRRRKDTRRGITFVDSLGSKNNTPEEDDDLPWSPE